MTSARIAKTTVAKSVMLVDEFTARGWTANRHPVLDSADVSQSALLRPPSGAVSVKLTIVTYPDGGTLAELIYEPSRGKGYWSGGNARSYWRMSVFNAPASAILATAHIAITGENGPTFDTVAYEGWETCATYTAGGHLQSTSFAHPTGQVAAVYHYPDTPGECGAWLISGPSCHADATGHTPAPVIRALAENLLVR
ncbi:hypothetical protein [Catenulispora rubra]|uniref:hypothetical protein n=1 Tax=Catenulispora rubra TaxID=280293 RepID=UPI0018923D6D|nr:hypothetical protein [Catenulispora rubra]